MGADRVIAVNVGDLECQDTRSTTSLLGLAMETLDAMMRANTLRATTEVDMMINVPLEGFGSLDWRRAGDLIKQGYVAGEAMKERLLPLAVSEAEWQQWHDARMRARKTALPVPAFVDVVGAGASDAQGMRMLLQQHVGVPLDLTALEDSLRELGGLDRYETLSWALVTRGNGSKACRLRPGRRVTVRRSCFSGSAWRTPPVMSFALDWAAGISRSTSWDRDRSCVSTSASDQTRRWPRRWYRPLWSPKVFIEPLVGVGQTSLSLIDDGRTIAEYRRSRVGFIIDGGVNLGRIDELRGGRVVRMELGQRPHRRSRPAGGGRQDSDVHAEMDPRRPGRRDRPVAWHACRKRVAALSSCAICSGGGFHQPHERRRHTNAIGRVVGEVAEREQAPPRLHGRRLRNLLHGEPLQTEQFALGGPLHMSAYSVGEKRGDHYLTGGVGYLHQLFRLPDFLGGPVFLGGWGETGSAFDDFDTAEIDTHFSAGVIADTLLGPVFMGLSYGTSGASRYYIGIGKIFR